MTSAELVAAVLAAGADDARLGLVSVDLAFPERSEEDRARVKRSLEAAAVPHWFDPGIIAALAADVTSGAPVTDLTRLTCVEPFPSRGAGASNVHEKTRLALRGSLRRDDPERFRALSQLARDAFDGTTVHGRVERLYLRFGFDPEGAAEEALDLADDVYRSGRPEAHAALAGIMEELLGEGVPAGRVRAAMEIVACRNRAARGEAAGLLERVARARGECVGEPRLEAEAACLVGDAHVARGELSAAQVAFGRFLAISRRFAEQDPANARWQWELAVAQSRVGGALAARGDGGGALAAYRESLRILARLAEQDPANAGWQRDLALAQSRVGGALAARGDGDGALAAYREGLRILAPLAAYRESLRISARLAEQDPANAEWQRDLAVAHYKVGAWSPAHYSDAVAAMRRAVAIAPHIRAWADDLDIIEATARGRR